VQPVDEGLLWHGGTVTTVGVIAVKAKKRCCASRPRCKRCPVVLARLEQQGLAERVAPGRYVLSVDLTKKALKAARRKRGRDPS